MTTSLIYLLLTRRKMSLLQEAVFQEGAISAEIGKTGFQPFDTSFLVSVILLKGAFIMGK